MIKHNNQEVQDNFLGLNYITKVYAGENLVLGQEKPEKNYFGIQAIENTSVGLTSSKTGGIDIKYSTDKENWTQWNYGSNSNQKINLQAGETVYFKGNNPEGLANNTNKVTKFNFTGRVKGVGSIQSLFYNDEFENNLVVPPVGCPCLFENCSTLIEAPELPATSIDSTSYTKMFYNCINLVKGPELPITTVGPWACQYMFYGCSKMTEGPSILPATTLTASCYQLMFYQCSSLTKAPVLPATTLISNCYDQMFKYCSKLNYIKAMFTTTPSTSYTNNWVGRVSNTGVFIKNSQATWNVTGDHGIPSGWTVEIASE